MSTTEQRLPAAQVLPYAMMVRAALKPVCLKTAVAGSLRRKRAEVSDIDIVVVPKRGLDLFGEETAEPIDFTLALSHLIADGVLSPHPTKPSNGDKHKRFLVPDLQIALEIAVANVNNYGCLLAIRTGPHLFSKRLVAPRPWGRMPPGMRQADGYLWRGDLMISCPTEEHYFEALGVPDIEPQDRSEEALSWNPAAAAQSRNAGREYVRSKEGVAAS